MNTPAPFTPEQRAALENLARAYRYAVKEQLHNPTPTARLRDLLPADVSVPPVEPKPKPESK